MSQRQKLLAVSALVASAVVVGCHNDTLGDPNATPTGPVATGDTVALTSTGKVITFGRAPSATLTSSQPITGLAAGESLLGIDTRPKNSLIYALSDQANLYTLDPSTGIVTRLGALKASTTAPTNAASATNPACPAATAAPAYTALVGTEFGIDVNPAVDRLRVVSNTGQNLRINMDTQEVTADCNISAASGMPKPSAVGYTNSVVGMTDPATATALFYIDTDTDMLYNVDPGTATPANNANTGVIKAVGPLGVNVTAVNGFDIAGTTPYAVFTVGTTTGFYRIDLTTGAATAVANFSQPDTLRGLALK